MPWVVLIPETVSEIRRAQKLGGEMDIISLFERGIYRIFLEVQKENRERYSSLTDALNPLLTSNVKYL